VMGRSGARGRGFTLIEVLVALVIVAIGMAAVLSALTGSAHTVIFMRDKTLANWLALNIIAQQRLAPQMPAQGNTDGDVDYAGQKWHWRQEVVPTAVQGMVRIDVMVRPADIKDDDDKSWYVTLSGIMDDAVAPPRGDMPLWGSGNTTPIPGQGTGTNGTGNNNGLGGGTGTGSNTGTGGTGGTGTGTGTGTTPH
jgi:general secretion pathway protein I